MSRVLKLKDLCSSGFHWFVGQSVRSFPFDLTIHHHHYHHHSGRHPRFYSKSCWSVCLECQSFTKSGRTVRRPNEKDRELPIVFSSVASRECPSGTAADGGIAWAERVLLQKGVCWKRIARRAFSLATQISLCLDPRWSSPARTAGWDRSPERRHQSVNSRCLASVQEPW